MPEPFIKTPGNHWSIRIALLIVSSYLLAISAAHAQPSQYVIIGYVTGSGWTKDQIDPTKLTHINYAFAVPDSTGKLAPMSATDAANMAALVSLKAQNKDLKILLSVGGWGGCRYFSDAALTDASRRTFANSAADALVTHKLDGIDIDWEYPAQMGAGNIFRAADKQNYTLFLKAIRDRLDEQGKIDNRTGKNHYLLTTATGGDTAFVRHTELGKAQQYLDYVNIMTYDTYHGNDTVTGHHSPLYQSKRGNQSRNSSVSAVDGHIRAGVPAHKIVLGLPFYGRGWAGVTNKDWGLYQPADGKHSFISHDKLVAEYINKNGFVRHWDADARAPYLWNADTRTFITYEDEQSLTPKLAYVKTKKLAGVMFWEYTYDVKQDKLLNKVVLDLREPAPAPHTNRLR